MCFTTNMHRHDDGGGIKSPDPVTNKAKNSRLFMVLGSPWKNRNLFTKRFFFFSPLVHSHSHKLNTTQAPIQKTQGSIDTQLFVWIGRCPTTGLPVGWLKKDNQSIWRHKQPKPLEWERPLPLRIQPFYMSYGVVQAIN